MNFQKIGFYGGGSINALNELCDQTNNIFSFVFCYGIVLKANIEF